MGDCKYCGKSAGIFSHAHKECEEKHNQGIIILEGALRSFFRNSTPASELQRVVSLVRQAHYATDADIAASAAKCLDEWTNVIHWPFHTPHLQKVKDLLAYIGVSYNAINTNGSLDRLCQKMLRGFMAEYFTDQKTLQRSLQISQKVMLTMPLNRQQQQDAYYEMLGQAGKNFLKDGYMSPSEQQKVDEYVSTLGLSLINLPPSLKGSSIEELSQATILNDLQSGRPPRYNIQAPIILTKGEVALWCYNNVTMYQEKIKREMVGSHSGFSFNMGAGSLYVTNKNIIFMGQMRSIKVPYTKIIGINPYSDGMEVQRDGNNVKRLVFQGFDCSFVLNVINNLN